MHTTTDLRAALRQLADAAPEPAPLPGDQDELLPAAKRSRHRSAAVRFGAPTLAGAMVAGVVAGVLTLNSGSHRAAQPGGPPTRTTAPVTVPAWLTETVFDVKARPGMTVGAPSADGASQQRYLSWDGFRTDSNQAIVRVWAPGRWIPSRPADAQDVTINGKPGFYGKITNQAVQPARRRQAHPARLFRGSVPEQGLRPAIRLPRPARPGGINRERLRLDRRRDTDHDRWPAGLGDKGHRGRRRPGCQRGMDHHNDNRRHRGRHCPEQR